MPSEIAEVKKPSLAGVIRDDFDRSTSG